MPATEGTPSPRTGVRLGIDPGSVRVGVARSDPAGTVSVPVTTVLRGRNDVTELVALVDEYEAIEVVVGSPLSLNGKPGPSATVAMEFARRLAEAIPHIPVRVVDERLTTVEATRALQSSGKNAKQSRSVVDQAAAAILLQHVLDAERMTGHSPGTIVRTS